MGGASYGTNQTFPVSYSRSPIMGIKWLQQCIGPVYFPQIIKDAVELDQHHSVSRLLEA